MQDKEFFSVVVGIARYENYYIDEWINYHLLIGFDHIFLYDNSEEGEENLSYLRETYPDRVTVTPFPGRYMQGAAYTHFLENFSKRAEWVAFLDIDEFLIFKQDYTVQNFLSKYGHLESIAISWLSFGHSGHEKRIKGTVIDNYTWRFPVYLSEVKTICKCNSIVEIHSAHNINGNAKLIDGTSLNGKSLLHHDSEIKYSKSLDFTDVVCINHYFTRSLEDLEIKASRGSVAGTVQGRRDFSWYFDNADIFNWTLDLNAPKLIRALVKGRDDAYSRYFALHSTLADRWPLPLAWDFDPIWYQNFYPDLKNKNLSPEEVAHHFSMIGAHEGRVWNATRWEGAFFDAGAYLENNPDLIAAGLSADDAHYHYLIQGQRRGRAIFTKEESKDKAPPPVETAEVATPLPTVETVEAEKTPNPVEAAEPATPVNDLNVMEAEPNPGQTTP